MRYFQKYSYREHNHGTQTVIFAVSDSYEELFQNIGIETDIFILESVRKDLNTEEGSFAIDELPFSINQLACQSDEDHNALFFCLNATDLKFNRYCALFFGSLPILENLDFIGKIDSKVSGDDKIWQSGNYGFEINPLREYNFTAYSFDIRVLEEAKITSNIYKTVDNDNIQISNIIDRWRDNNYQTFSELFNHEIFFWRNTASLQYCYFSPLGNLYKIIQKYLDFTAEILQEKLGISLNLQLLESDLGIGVQLAVYKFIQTLINGFPVSRWEVESGEEIRGLRLRDNWVPDSTTSAAHICIKMIDPYYSADSEEDETIASNEKEFSFLMLDNTAELLFSIARSLACYILPSYVAGNQINFEFKSRKGIVENDYTYIIGSQEAGFDTSSILTSNKNSYYSNANNNANDGFDSYVQGDSSKDFTTKNNERKLTEQRKNIKYDRLLFSSSPTMIGLKNEQGIVRNYQPLNAVYRNSYLRTYDESNYDYGIKYKGEKSSYLHTSIYIHTVPAPESEVATNLGSIIPVARPVAGVVAKVNNENMHFNTLTDYVNYIMSRDVQYYETEYNLTVPYWNGFSKNTDGSNPSWKNIKLGSKIKLYESIKRYEDEEWIDVDVQREYVVVGIERNLQKPETTLKLHSLDRFAFGTWDSPVSPPVFIFQPGTQSNLYDESMDVESFESDTEIESGDVVMIKPNQKIMKAENKSIYYHYPIGIALSSGGVGDTIVVQLSGLVKSSRYDFLQAGKMIQLRYNPADLNLSTSLLEDKTADEDMIVNLGLSVSPDSLFMNIQRMELP
ncbi:MAG: hypothetical protein KIT33_12585 [Candidatus Kapabacteria bacterium]|nr:hypothetical protein [Ignavibacteriota bacterium]MCW5885797.1 hypothetical protein [Candidatus Kapabacteria bacterium]